MDNAYTLEELNSFTDTFKEENLIGEGGYCTVHRGKIPQPRMAPPLLVAVKVTKQNPQSIPQFENELPYLRKLRHPNIIGLIGHLNTVDKRYIVMERAFGVLKHKIPTLSCQRLLEILKGVANAILFIHFQNLRIGDLKPENILLDRAYSPKLCDFGTMDTPSPNTTAIGTIGYIDPDFLEGDMASLDNDTYAFGVILLQALRRETVIREGNNLVQETWTAYQAERQRAQIRVEQLVHESYLREGGLHNEDALRLVELGLAMTRSLQGTTERRNDELQNLFGGRYQIAADRRRISMATAFSEIHIISRKPRRRGAMRLPRAFSWLRRV